MNHPRSVSQASDASGVDLTERFDEQLLVERIRAGDPLAFEAIFRRYHAECRSVAEPIVGSSAAAEDVVQDLFFRIWQGRQRWNVSVSVRAYLRRAARNVALRHLERASARGHDSLAVDGGGSTSEVRGPVLVDPTPSPVEQAEAAILAAELTAATEALPDRPRVVFQLSREQGLSTKQIAERLGLSPKTVEIYMTRALTALRAAVTRWRSPS